MRFRGSGGIGNLLDEASNTEHPPFLGGGPDLSMAPKMGGNRWKLKFGVAWGVNRFKKPQRQPKPSRSQGSFCQLTDHFLTFTAAFFNMKQTSVKLWVLGQWARTQLVIREFGGVKVQSTKYINMAKPPGNSWLWNLMLGFCVAPQESDPWLESKLCEFVLRCVSWSFVLPG